MDPISSPIIRAFLKIFVAKPKGDILLSVILPAAYLDIMEPGENKPLALITCLGFEGLMLLSLELLHNPIARSQSYKFLQLG